MKAKPASAVTVLADGTVPLTAFVPDDLAFRRLVQELQGGRLPSERAATTALVGLGVPTVERVLLYHVVPGVTVNAKAALKADGANLTTAQGSPVKVKVSLRYPRVTIALGDRKGNAPDPRVVQADLNSGNRQIAHAVDAVLRLPTP